MEFLQCRLETNLHPEQQFCTMKALQIISLCKLPSKAGREYKWPALNDLHPQLFGMEFSGSYHAGVAMEACAQC